MTIPDQETFRPLIRAGVAALVILAVFLAIQSVAGIYEITDESGEPGATISVSGQGSEFGMPDTATFQATVVETGDTVQAVQQEATERMNTAIDRITSFGVDEEDIKTVTYDLRPQYEEVTKPCVAGEPCPSRTERTIVGYELRHGIEVKVEERKQAGKIVSALGDLGVQEIGNIRMTIEDPEELKVTAREKAITQAKQKAERLARDLGVTLERIVTFNESGGGIPRPYATAEVSRGSAGDTQTSPKLPAGRNEITSSVTITYEIE